jgi:serine protease AprX
VIGQAAATITLTEAPYYRQLGDDNAKARLDISNIQADGAAAKAALQRQQAREAMLLADEYDNLRARTTAYLASNSSGLTPMANFYDPSTDPGSLYNVEKSIGIDQNSPTGLGVKVALIDTGVVDVDGLSQANVTIGPDFSFEDMNPDTRGKDANGHGTHLAGIIAGSNDSWAAGDHTRTATRFLGIAPDAQLVSIKAGTADGTTDVTQVIAAINYVIRYNQTAAAADRIRVINLSYGTDSQQDYSVDPLSYAAERAWKAGIVVVVAAGNDGWDANRLTDPASDPYVIAVGAAEGTGGNSVAADYSSEGSQDRTVDIVAPGRSIVSLRNPGSWSDQFNSAGRADDRFVRGSGTSQAAAVVTGSVADLLQAQPNLTPDQVKAMLEQSATPLAASDPRLSGYGELNIGRAIGMHTVYAWQTYPSSDGSGSVEASRGTSHVLADDGTPFTGEQDVFGANYSATGWADDSWEGSAWRSSDWTASRWTGLGWSGSRWTGSSWSASRWTGSSWSGSRWSGSRWSGSSWSASRWSGFSDL